LYSYKALKGEWGDPDWSSIESAPSEADFTDFGKFASTWLRDIKAQKVKTSDLVTKSGHWPIITTAGPNSKISFLGAAQDAWSWAQQPVNHAKAWFQLVDPDVADLMSTMETRPFRHHDPKTGKLSLKWEAAGKVRIFAICDYWTQVALKPLHEHLLRVLSALPTDATFNQVASVESLAAEGHKELFSYDLKSATDLIPKQIYVELLRHLMGPEVTEAWILLLTDRVFSRPKGHEGPPIRYTRGQPMGAYSSWAALALGHHALVQFAAHRVGKYPFSAYRVLGDDITIASKEVASEYLQLCEQYGIPVGLAKSYVSKIGLFNFANQTFLDGSNLSPASLKEFLKGPRNSATLTGLADRLMSRGWFPVKIPALLRLFVPPKDWSSLRGALIGEEHNAPLLRRVSRTILWVQSPLAKALAPDDIQLYRAWMAAVIQPPKFLAGGMVTNSELPFEKELLSAQMALKSAELSRSVESLKKGAMNNLVWFQDYPDTEEANRLDIAPLLEVVRRNFTVLNHSYRSAVDGYWDALALIPTLEKWTGFQYQYRNLQRLLEAEEALTPGPRMDSIENFLALGSRLQKRKARALPRLVSKLERAYKTFSVDTQAAEQPSDQG